MDIHNTMEDLVIAEVNAICDSLEAAGKKNGICTCAQCRQDAICFVLNRTWPHYVVSHRGAARVGQAADQQSRADLTALVYEGIKRVSHNQRPYVSHGQDQAETPAPDTPVFNIPTIMGRVFNGLNFSPVTDSTVELFQNGALAPMRDSNWQNPYILIPNTGGSFTFWPRPVPAEKTDVHSVFEYTINIHSPGMADMSHVFTVPAVSEKTSPTFSLSRTFKLPDLYLFPPGDENNQRVINE
jgi:competence protein ComFB